MTAKNDGAADVVKTEVAKGQQDDVLEDYPREREKTRGKPRSKMPVPRTAKISSKKETKIWYLSDETYQERAVPQVAAMATSARIRELARPTRQRVLNTLNEKALTLPPAFVDNLIRIIEAESCLTPEEAARVRRRKERRARKATRLPPPSPLSKKRAREIAEDTELDRGATTCQYLMAERFVKSILGYRRATPREDVREIADVIMRRLASLDGYADARNGDRATRQLRLLADVVARWVAEILAEVAEARKEALEEYCEKRRMRMMEVDDDDETDSETEAWRQMEQTKGEIKQEGTDYETKKRNNSVKERNEEENEQKGENKEKDKGERKKVKMENDLTKRENEKESEQKEENKEGERKEIKVENNTTKEKNEGESEQKEENKEGERKKIKVENNTTKEKNEEKNEQKGENKEKNKEGEREELKTESKEDEATMKKEQAKEKEQLDEKEVKNKNEENKTVKEQRTDENVKKEEEGKEMRETEKKEGKEKEGKEATMEK